MERPTITTATLELRLHADGMLRCLALPGRVQSIEDARENVAALKRLTGGKRVPMLLDIRDAGTLSRDAREYYAGYETAKSITGLAFITDSAFSRVVANFFIRLAKTRYPIRLFEDQEAAVDWLSGLSS